MQRLLSGKVELETIAICQKNWIELIFQKPIKDTEMAIRLKTPTLSALKNFRDETYCLNTIVAIITEVCENLNIKGAMNENQIVFAAKEILSDYYFLRLSELRFCFTEGVKGRYGQIYDRFDVSVMYEWLSCYDKNRAEVKTAIELKKKEEANTEGVFLSNASEEIRNEFYALLKRITPKNKTVTASLIYEYCNREGIDFVAHVQGLEKRYNESKDKELYSLNEFIEIELEKLNQQSIL